MGVCAYIGRKYGILKILDLYCNIGFNSEFRIVQRFWKKGQLLTKDWCSEDKS